MIINIYLYFPFVHIFFFKWLFFGPNEISMTWIEQLLFQNTILLLNTISNTIYCKINHLFCGIFAFYWNRKLSGQDAKWEREKGKRIVKGL